MAERSCAHRRALLFLSVVVLCGCRAPRPAPAPESAPPEPGAAQAIVLPVRWVLDYPLVRVMLGDQGPYDFVLDSGTDSIAIRDKLAAVVGKDLRPGAVEFTDPAGRQRTMDAVRLDGMMVGDVAFGPFGAVVAPMEDIQEALGVRVDGVLGIAVFEGLSLCIDYPHRRVSLSRVRLEKAGDPGTFHFDTTLPRVELEIGKASYEAVVDTGNSGPLGFPRDMRKRIRWGVKPVPAGISATLVAKSGPMLAGRLADPVRIGPFTITAPIATLGDETAPVLGTGILRNFKLTFDMERKLVRFERASGPVVTIPSQRGIGAGLLKKAGGWTVAYTFPKSPARLSGLAVGDRLVTVNGRPAGDLTAGDLHTLIDKSDRLSLEILRTDKTRRALEIEVETLVP